MLNFQFKCFTFSKKIMSQLCSAIRYNRKEIKMPVFSVIKEAQALLYNSLVLLQPCRMLHGHFEQFQQYFYKFSLLLFKILGFFQCILQNNCLTLFKYDELTKYNLLGSSCYNFLNYVLNLFPNNFTCHLQYFSYVNYNSVQMLYYICVMFYHFKVVISQFPCHSYVFSIYLVSVLSFFLEGFMAIQSARILAQKILINIVDLVEMKMKMKQSKTQKIHPVSVYFKIAKQIIPMNYMYPLFQFLAIVRLL